MKKTLFTLVLGASIFIKANAQVDLGIHFDGVMTGNTIKENGRSVYQDEFFTWKVGILSDIGISKRFSFMPQLNMVKKGGSDNSYYLRNNDPGPGLTSIKTVRNLSIDYIELPLYLVYKKAGFFAGIGPVLSVALSGDMDTVVTISNSISTPPQTNGYTHSPRLIFNGRKNNVAGELHLKRFEFSVDVLAGYRFKNDLFINASCSLGVTDILPDHGKSWRNSYFGLGIGSFLRNKKAKSER